MDTNKSLSGKGLERMSSSQAAAKKLTLMDLIEDHGSRAGAPAPAVHLTRHSASREHLLKKEAAALAASGVALMPACCVCTGTTPCKQTRIEGPYDPDPGSLAYCPMLAWHGCICIDTFVCRACHVGVPRDIPGGPGMKLIYITLSRSAEADVWPFSDTHDVFYASLTTRTVQCAAKPWLELPH